MRIAFDNQIFCNQSWGGISRYFVRLAEELHATGQDVAVLAPFHRNHHLELAAPAVARGRSINAWPRRLGRLALRLNPVLGARGMRRWNPRIVHETYYQAPELPVVNAPRVLTVYDMIHERLPGSFRPDDKTAQRKRHAVMRADHVICISENTRQDLLEFIGIDKDRTSVVHLGVDRPTEAEPALAPPAPEPYILFVGQRGGYKNFELLLRAVAATPWLLDNFSLYCFGGDILSSTEKALMARLGYRPGQVRRLAGDDDALAALYRQASVFVQTSLYEGFGLPPLEAMAQGCPVLSSNSSCMPEVLGDAAEWFDPQAIDALQQALQSVLSSPQHAEELRQRGYQRCQSLTWERCASQTLNVYRSLLT